MTECLFGNKFPNKVSERFRPTAKRFITLAKEGTTMKKQMLIMATMVLCVLSTASTWAAPILQVKGGGTSMVFAVEMVDELAFAGAEILGVRPGSVGTERRRLRLPITGGLIDFEDLSGEIDHAGGMRLVSSNGEASSLQRFRIDTLGEVPLMTAITTLGGDLFGRLDLFELRFTDMTKTQWNDRATKLGVRNVDLLLTLDAARYFNEFFGTSFVEGTLVGNANIRVKFRHHRSDDDDAQSDRERDGDSGRDTDTDRDSDEDRDDDDDDPELSLGSSDNS
ncbi:MAG: hypothetical protein ACI9A2_000277 [Halioglobus sp.]